MAPNRVGMGWFAGTGPAWLTSLLPLFHHLGIRGLVCMNGIDPISRLKTLGDPEALDRINDLFHAME